MSVHILKHINLMSREGEIAWPSHTHLTAFGIQTSSGNRVPTNFHYGPLAHVYLSPSRLTQVDPCFRKCEQTSDFSVQPHEIMEE
ncbi:hypothetical protein NPIL_12951 [Nephila pilipes]|uniref:Uncharacterized protein n=1 Tax=Nephila pilipes TaxID=299642 RepID=A0A8X6MNX2_NEPPI|nr:hypothetical protein NPIL_12951 [Nephila pilipes]